MAFTRLGEFQAKLFEKSCSSFTKAADMRWQDYGEDLKKSTTADNLCVGPVAYVQLTDPKNSDPVIAKKGNVVRMFFNCVGANPDSRYAMIETEENADNAVSVSIQWVADKSGVTVTGIQQLCPTA